MSYLWSNYVLCPGGVGIKKERLSYDLSQLHLNTCESFFVKPGKLENTEWKEIALKMSVNEL